MWRRRVQGPVDERGEVRLGKKVTILSLALAVACAAALAAPALAGKKKKTTVVVNAGSVLSGQQNVKVKGALNTATACRAARSMRLFLTDATGAIQSTLDSGTSSGGGSWTLKAKLESDPTSDQYLQVKAKKLTVGKYVCKAGASGLLAIK